MENLNSINKLMTERKWFVVYTRPRWEKKIEKELQMAGITAYCPVRKVKNQWADRVKEVELPLFSSYVFVKINAKEDLKVRTTTGVMNFVYYMGKPAQIRDVVIDEIKCFLELFPSLEAVGLQQLNAGDRVIIKEGIMTQKQGEILQVRGKNVLVVIDCLHCALITKIPVSNLELIN